MFRPKFSRSARSFNIQPSDQDNYSAFPIHFSGHILLPITVGKDEDFAPFLYVKQACPNPLLLLHQRQTKSKRCSLLCHMEERTAATQQRDPRCLSSGGYKLLQIRTGQRPPQRGGKREKPRRWGLPEPRAEAGARQHPRTCRERLGGPRLPPAQPGARTAEDAASPGPTLAAGEHSPFRQRPARSSPARDGAGPGQDRRPQRNRPRGGGSSRRGGGEGGNFSPAVGLWR